MLTMGHRTGSAGERGQVVVVFALALVTLLGFAGLALDGGSTLGVGRSQQTATDLAALAGANDVLVNGTNWWWSNSSGSDTARAVASHNGFTHGVDGTTVSAVMDSSNGVAVTVTISSPHPNTLAGVFGMPTWMVTTTATALAGFPDTAEGAHAFATDGTPLYTTPTGFGQGNGDVPNNATDIAWTNYGTGNVDTSQVDQIISGQLVVSPTLEFGQYIGQKNAGYHNFLFTDVNTYLAGRSFPSPVVDDNGNFAGWATFHVISADANSTKQIQGYFETNFVSSQLTITNCSSNACPRYLGSYVLKLSN
jgi:hypothetical protein